jgi:hypothetical protein
MVSFRFPATSFKYAHYPSFATNKKITKSEGYSKMKKGIIMAALFVLMLSLVNAFEINAPASGTLDHTNVKINITNEEMLDSISYNLNNVSFQGCVNCTGFTTEVNLGEGNHTLTAQGVKGNVTYNDTVEFEIVIPVQDFDFTIVKPTSGTYPEGQIEVRIISNMVLEKISMSVGDYNDSCSNCSLLGGYVNLTNGTYALMAFGQRDSVTKAKNVTFTVNDSAVPGNASGNSTGNQTGGNLTNATGNQTRDPRFALGFEKLPKQVQNGEINDSELAEIIRNNQLNPGIINRLIRTGKLGNESLEAILDYQEFRPTGIWNKLLAFIGFKENTYAARIAKKYELPEKLKQKLVTGDDLPKGLSKKVEAGLRKTVENKELKEPTEKKEKGKSLEVGKQLPKPEKSNDVNQGPGNGNNKGGKKDGSSGKGNNGKGNGSGNGKGKGNGHGNSGNGNPGSQG